MSQEYLKIFDIDEIVAKPLFEAWKEKLKMEQPSKLILAAKNDRYNLYYDYNSRELVIESALPEITEAQRVALISSLLL